VRSFPKRSGRGPGGRDQALHHHHVRNSLDRTGKVSEIRRFFSSPARTVPRLWAAGTGAQDQLVNWSTGGPRSRRQQLGERLEVGCGPEASTILFRRAGASAERRPRSRRGRLGRAESCIRIPMRDHPGSGREAQAWRFRVPPRRPGHRPGRVGKVGPRGVAQ